MKIAVEGCCHGDLDAIYSQISHLEAKHQYKVDLLLICGDFQAVRNHADLQCMAVPDKYKELKDFHKYYSGAKAAPILTIVIGGNHEASNYMWELYHGGWLAPNIFFLGHAGSVFVNGIRISGASGIFKSHDFRQGHHEKVPYDSGAMRSIYHIREYCVRKLSLLPASDIFLSHDWPQGIEHYGDLPSLLSRKKFLRPDIDSGRLGSPPLMGLLTTLKPQWWFAAHLHTRFEAQVIHGDPGALLGTPVEAKEVRNPDEIVIDDDDEEDGPAPVAARAPDLQAPESKNTTLRNPDEIMMEDEEEDVAIPPPPPPPPSITNFLALDKCLPRRQFLEVIDLEPPTPEEDAPALVPAPAPPLVPAQPDSDPSAIHPASDSAALPSHTDVVLAYDPAWLAITRAFHPLLSLARPQVSFPDEEHAREMVARELEWVHAHVPSKLGGGWAVRACQEFVGTAPAEQGTEGKRDRRQPPWYTNPQTEAFCAMLEIPNKINPPPAGSESLPKTSPSTATPPAESAPATIPE